MKKIIIEAYNLLKVKIMVTNFKGEIIFVNKYLCDYFHKKYEDIQSDSIFNFVLPDEKEYLISSFSTFLKTGENKIKEIRIIIDDKVRYFEIKSVLREKNIVHTIRDITKERKNKDILRRKNELIGTMNKILSHDLTNTFSVILSALRIFNHTGDKEMISATEKESRKGISIINRLRGLRSTIENEEDLRIYNLKNVIDSVVNQSQIFVEVTGEGKALADGLLPNVFENIFNNAIKHGNAGKIEITIEENAKEHKTIVKIKNDGNQIEEKILPNIFQEGIKGEKTGNTGIGLSIVQKTIFRYGGHIKAENIEEGVLFTLEFQML